MLNQEDHGKVICQKKCISLRIPTATTADLFAEKPPPPSAPEIRPPKSCFYSHDRTEEAMQRSCFIGLFLIALLFFPISLSYSQEIEFQARDWQKAYSCRLLAEELLDQGFLEASIAKFKEAVEIVENASGNESPLLVDYLDAISGVNLALGECENAEIFAQRALKINKKAFTRENRGAHVEVAKSLDSLGKVYQVCGDYSKAEDSYNRALTIKAVKLGSTHSEVIKSSEILAELHQQYGYYEKAEPFLRYLGSLGRGPRGALGEFPGTENAGLVNTLLVLGTNYKVLGKYALAERAYSQALSMSEKAYGSNNPNLAPFLHGLAELYHEIGYDVKAKDYYTKAMEILEKAYVPGKPNAEWILDWITKTVSVLGDDSKAEYFIRCSIAEKEKMYGTDDPRLAILLQRLAFAYQRRSEADKAESCLLRAVKIQEKAYGPKSPQVSGPLHDLGALYLRIEQFGRAVSVFEKVLDIDAEHFGMENPRTAEDMADLARIYLSAGNIEKADYFGNRALGILERHYGAYSLQVYKILQVLGQIAAVNGDFEKSLDLFLKAENLDIEAFRQITQFTNENLRVHFILQKNPIVILESLFTLIARHLPTDHAAKVNVFNVWLRRKGLASNVEKALHKESSKDPQAANLLSDLQVARLQLSRLAFSKATSGNNAADFKTVTHELETRIENLEIELSRRSRIYNLHYRVLRESCAALAAALPEKAVLVDFAKASLISFHGDLDLSSRRGLAHYFAFILPAKEPGRLQLIDLGEAKQIDNAVAQFRKEIAHMDEKAVQSSRDIYDMIFDPIKRELGDAERLLISPDGDLHLIPFELLQGPNGKYLIEEFSISYVSASQEIFGFGQIISQGEDNIIIGDPDFDMKAQEGKPDPSDSPPVKITGLVTNRRSADLADFRFKRLPHTKEEALAVQSLLGKDKTKLYTGKEAKKSLLRHCRNPRILHLATHGFFLGDQQRPGVDPYKIALESRQVSLAFEQSGVGKSLENPMLRSGIALAGANTFLSSLEGQEEDGILTAEEILGLNLWGTDMVVLSAGGTGLGDLRNGEGVFGLRRAFTLAGAKSLVVSLWSVPDEETKELMTQFYKNLATSGMDRCQALRQAMLREMEIVEKRYGSAYPLCWGGFVFVGDPGRPSVN